MESLAEQPVEGGQKRGWTHGATSKGVHENPRHTAALSMFRTLQMNWASRASWCTRKIAEASCAPEQEDREDADSDSGQIHIQVSAAQAADLVPQCLSAK